MWVGYGGGWREGPPWPRRQRAGLTSLTNGGCGWLGPVPDLVFALGLHGEAGEVVGVQGVRVTSRGGRSRPLQTLETLTSPPFPVSPAPEDPPREERRGACEPAEVVTRPPTVARGCSASRSTARTQCPLPCNVHSCGCDPPPLHRSLVCRLPGGIAGTVQPCQATPLDEGRPPEADAREGASAALWKLRWEVTRRG